MVLVWVIGGVVLVAAGFATALLPRWRARRADRRVAWSTARAALDRAAISREAAPQPVPAAERLLAEAELIAARGGGPTAAQRVAAQARRADRLWQEAAGTAPPTAGTAPPKASDG